MAEPLPCAVATAERVVADGVTLRVSVLDDGRRVVEKAGFDAFCRAVQAGRLTPRQVITAALWVKHGDA